MRPVIYFAATSLDGFIARLDGGIDWLFHDQDYGFSQFLEGIDAVVMGRKTYEQSLSFGESPFGAKEHFIFSRSGAKFEGVAVVNQPVEEFVQLQKTRPGRGIWLVGGGDLAGAFFAAGAVDELIVFVHPVLIHAGLPLAARVPRDVKLRFKDSHPFDTGLVRLRYDVLRP